jgi:hypothetical protein
MGIERSLVAATLQALHTPPMAAKVFMIKTVIKLFPLIDVAERNKSF